MNFFKQLQQRLFGKPEEMQSVSTLTPQQQKIQSQLEQSMQQKGAGGAFGDTADYYRDLLSNDGQTANMFAQPMMRQFNEEVIPGLSEQFAGMGSGGLSSSSFRNAAVNEGAGLSERIGSMRAGLRQQGAQGLQGMGAQSLAQTKENIFRPETHGFIGNAVNALAGGVGQGLGMAATGGIGALSGLAGKATSMFSNPWQNANQGPRGGGQR